MFFIHFSTHNAEKVYLCNMICSTFAWLWFLISSWLCASALVSSALTFRPCSKSFLRLRFQSPLPPSLSLVCIIIPINI